MLIAVIYMYIICIHHGLIVSTHSSFAFPSHHALVPSDPSSDLFL